MAVDADTGHYVWHYQTTPGDAWDYDSATDMTLADLNIEGHRRSVLLHAAKNGFFYVIDRENGRLISAEKLGTVTWAERVDLATGQADRKSRSALSGQERVAVAELSGRASLDAAIIQSAHGTCVCAHARNAVPFRG